MNNRKTFMDYMAALGELFDKEITKTLLGMYWEVLSAVPDDRAEDAFKKSIATCKFFPRPAELLELAGESNKLKELMIDSRAQEQALLVLEMIRGSVKESDATDKITKHLLERRFNVSRLSGSMLEVDNKWFLKDFAEAYRNTAELSQADMLSLDGGNVALKQLAEIGGRIEYQKENDR